MNTHNMYWWMVWLVMGSIFMGFVNLVMNILILLQGK